MPRSTAICSLIIIAVLGIAGMARANQPQFTATPLSASQEAALKELVPKSPWRAKLHSAKKFRRVPRGEVFHGPTDWAQFSPAQKEALDTYFLAASQLHGRAPDRIRLSWGALGREKRWHIGRDPDEVTRHVWLAPLDGAKGTQFLSEVQRRTGFKRIPSLRIPTYSLVGRDLYTPDFLFPKRDNYVQQTQPGQAALFDGTIPHRGQPGIRISAIWFGEGRAQVRSSHKPRLSSRIHKIRRSAR